VIKIGSPLLNNSEVNKLHHQYRLCFPLDLCKVVIKVIKEMNLEARSSREYSDKDGARPSEL
jgi:hypothetical protein